MTVNRLTRWMDRRVPGYTPDQEPPAHHEEASDAIRRAEQDLGEAYARERKVTSLVNRLEDQGRRNHFGEMLVMSMGGRGNGR